MQSLLMTIIGIWILKAAFEGSIGLLQILLGILLWVLGFCLWVFSFILEVLESLWHTAFPDTQGRDHN